MRDIFISYVEEEGSIAKEVAAGLEKAGYSTWYYERDSEPGPSYLLQTSQAIKQSQAVVLIISPHSITSHQMTKEIIRAHECNKPFIPLLLNIKETEFKKRQPEWEEALGAATSINIPVNDVAAITRRIVRGLLMMRIEPKSGPTAGSVEQASGQPYLAKVVEEEVIDVTAQQTVSLAQPASGSASKIESVLSTQPRLKANRIRLISAGVIVTLISAVAGYHLIYRGPAKPRLMTSEFSELFLDTSRWTKPSSGWAIKDGRLHIENQPLVGHPSDVYFGDFTMSFHLRLTNAGGAAWALRVKDRQNYYLFYLAGPLSTHGRPGFFYSYIVRDGHLGSPQSTIPVTTMLTTGGEYIINIIVKNNEIVHQINSADNPSRDPLGDPLGYFKDENNFFTSGSIGFRTLGLEKFSVAELYVRPPEVQIPQ
jgi:hypothetical protein